MARTSIPRGILPVQYRNADRSRTTKYRVRINRAGLKIDRYFDALEEAAAFREEALSPGFRDAFLKEKLAAQRDQFQPTLSAIFKEYERKFTPKKAPRTQALEHDYFTKTFAGTLIVPVQPGVSHFAKVQRKLRKADGVPLADMHVHRITTSHIEQYILARLDAGKSEATVRRELSTLGDVFKKLPKLVDTDATILPENPFAKLDKKALLTKKQTLRSRRLTTEEEERLFNALSLRRSPKIGLMVLFAFHSGMRLAEMLEMRWEHVEEARGFILVPNTKNRERHYVGISPILRQLLEALRRFKRKDGAVFGYTKDGWKSNWQRVRKAAAIQDFRFHDLRHEFVSRLAENGLGVFQIRALAGYSNPAHVKAKLADVTKQQSARRIAEGQPLTEHDLMSSLNHKTMRMTAGYANPSAVTMVENIDSTQALLARIEELEKKLAEKASPNPAT
jgi:integrase